MLTPSDGPVQGGGPTVPVERIALFGISLDNVDLEEATGRILRALTSRTRGYAVTPNVDHLVRLQRDAAFRDAYRAAAFRFADGAPLVWASRLLGRPLKARVAGADLLPAVCRMAAAHGYSVFVLGGAEDVARRAAVDLSRRFPTLRVAGVHTPPAGFGDDPAAVDSALAVIADARPDILFIGLGSPRQETWVHRNWARVTATVAVCCGAAIDFAAGTQTRAPGWMQRWGLEWLWRLAHEPRRLWRRYLVDDAAFLGIFLKEWWRLRVRREKR